MKWIRWIKMKLSIIIVNYNTYTLTKQTIDSVLEKKLPFKYEIMLVDNASQDDSMVRLQEDYKEIISQGLLNITLNDANLGFAKANNIEKVKGRVYLTPQFRYLCSRRLLTAVYAVHRAL